MREIRTSGSAGGSAGRLADLPYRNWAVGGAGSGEAPPDRPTARPPGRGLAAGAEKMNRVAGTFPAVGRDMGR